jgi:peptidyl-prolyl cis-trans isomerase A (cyclophilin A)
MKRLLLSIFVTGIVLAQTPAAPDLLQPSTMSLTAPATYRVKLTTTKGDIVIEVTRAWAPNGADRFYNLVRAGFYTNAPFYRVIPKFMAQFGVSARPDVNKAFDGQGSNIRDDPRNGKSNERGKVTFAMTSSPNSRSTSLFINTVNNAYLDNIGFVPIGEVVEGIEVADQLYSGYGDLSNHQDEFEKGGSAYVTQNFPMLDRILTGAVE